MNVQLKGGERYELFKSKHCSPKNKKKKKQTQGKHSSCLEEDLIKKIGKIMNQLKNKNFEKINLSNPCYEINDQICRNLKQIKGCHSEACILTIKDIFKKLNKKEQNKVKQSFKPLMSDDLLKKDNNKKKVVDKEAWLSTEDIENALKQHMDADNEFYFYGAVPIDFSDCSVSNLCSFNYKKHLDNSQSKIGIVFNTEPHDQSGQHWISLYMDLLGKNFQGIPAIYYFDSYGREPPSQIEELIKKAIQQSKEYGNPLKYFYNDKCYQKHGSQCGMYSIDFIKQMLENISFQRYLSNTGDSKMREKRDHYFINPEELFS